MMKIVVYGPGCWRCAEAEKVVRQAVEQMGFEAEVQKVSDPIGMGMAGVVLTPAVSIEGMLKVSGRIPREEEVRLWLGAEAAKAGRTAVGR